MALTVDQQPVSTDSSQPLRSSPRWFWVVGTILFATAAYFYLQYGWLHLRTSFAEEQTDIFDQMRQEAGNTDDPARQVGLLTYVVNYYPSGSKQIPGSPLDQIVERARQNAVREIIGMLRERTGQDFGEDPQHWIDGLKETKVR